VAVATITKTPSNTWKAVVRKRLAWWSAHVEERACEPVAGMVSRANMPAGCRSMVIAAAERCCRWLR
jgi:hypothetical protein